MMANVTCPSCHHKYWIQEGDMGSRQTCPNCQTSFFAGASKAEGRVPAKAAAVAAAAPPQAGFAKTMIGDTAPPIKYNCPRCKAPLEASASEAGTKLSCPKCSQRIQVPAAPKLESVVAVANLNKTMLAGDESAAPRPPIKYNCPNCKKPLEAPAEKGGTKANCPACNQRLQIPAAPALNKTRLASDESSAPANVAGGYVAGGAAGASSAAAGMAAAPSPWASVVTPKTVALGMLLLFLLLLLGLVVPAVIRGGKQVDNEALMKAQLELQKLQSDIEMKKKEMEIKAAAEADARHKIDEFLRESRQLEEKRQQEERRRLASIDDEDKRAAEQRRIRQERQQQETDRLEQEKRWKAMLADSQKQVEDAKKALESAQSQQQKTQTIVQQPPTVVYPYYHPRYYWPW